MKVEAEERKRVRGTRRCIDEARPSLSADRVETLSRTFDVLAHPIRLQLLDVLANNGGRVCVCDLDAALPVKQPTISHHLKVLRSAGIVESERHGNWAYYFVDPGALRALRTEAKRFFQGLERNPSNKAGGGDDD